MRRSMVQIIETEKNTFSMSNDLNMTVFLMSVEIERLNGEVDAWKLRYTDLDRRISDRGSVEDALHAESLKVLELRSQLAMFSGENSSLKSQIESLRAKVGQVDFSLQGKYEESDRRMREILKDLEGWKMRYVTLEKTKDKEMEELRMTFDARRKSYIEREVRDLTVRFNMDKSNWENDMRKLRDLLDARTRENEDLKGRYGKLEITIGEMKGSQSKIPEYENRLALMSSEIERLNAILKKKSDEIEDWKGRYTKIEITMNQGQGKDAKIRELEGILNNMQREIERLTAILREKANDADKEKTKRSKLEADLGNARVVEMRLKEYENKLALLTSEIERLNTVLVKEREEKDRLKGKLMDFESNTSTYQVQIKQWESRYNDSMREIEQWKKRFSELQVTIDEYRSYEVKVREYENKLALMSSEVTRLNDMMSKGKKENDILRIRIKELEQSEMRIREYENKIALLTSEIERLNSVIKNRGEDLDNWKNKYSKLEISISEYRGLEGRLRDYENTIAGMQREIERLNGIIRDNHDDLEREKTKRSKIESEMSSKKVLEMKLQEYENKMGLLTSEFERLNSVLVKEREEKEKLRRRNMELDSEISNLNKTNKQWEIRYNDTQRDFDNWKKRYAELEIKITEYRVFESKTKEYENKIALLSSEIQRLNDILGKFRGEVENYKVKIIEYEGNLTEASKYRMMVQEWESRYNRLTKELEDWKRKHGELTISINEYRGYEGRLKEYENKIAMISSENERLNNMLRKEREEVSGLRMKVSEYEIILKDIPGLQGQIRQWESRYNLILKELDDWKKKHGDLNIQIIEFNEVRKKLTEFQNSSFLLNTEIERLNAILSREREEKEMLKRKCYDFENALKEMTQLQALIKQWEMRFGEAAKRNDDWERKYGELQMKISEYRTIEIKLKEYENKIGMLSSEIERLNNVLKSRGEDIEGWKRKYSTLEISLIEARSLEIKIKEYEGTINMLQRELERLNDILRGKHDDLEKEKVKRSKLEANISVIKSLEMRIEEYENKIAMITSEIERLNNLLGKERDEKEKFRIKIYEYEQKLNSFSNVQRELDTWRKRYGELEITLSEYRTYEIRVKEYENKLVLLSSELERLKSMNNQKTEEIETWKIKYYKIESSLSQIRDYEMKIQMLGQEIDRLNDNHTKDIEEITIYKQKWVEYSHLSTKISEYMQLFVIMMAENEALRARVIEKENEVEEVRRQSLTPFRKSVSQIQAESTSIQMMTHSQSSRQSGNLGQSGQNIQVSQVEQLRKSGNMGQTGQYVQVSQVEQIKKSGNMGSNVQYGGQVSQSQGLRQSGNLGQNGQYGGQSIQVSPPSQGLRPSGNLGQSGQNAQFGGIQTQLVQTVQISPNQLNKSGEYRQSEGSVQFGQSPQYGQSSGQYRQSEQFGNSGQITTSTVTRTYEQQSPPSYKR